MNKEDKESIFSGFELSPSEKRRTQQAQDDEDLRKTLSEKIHIILEQVSELESVGSARGLKYKHQYEISKSRHSLLKILRNFENETEDYKFRYCVDWEDT